MSYIRFYVLFICITITYSTVNKYINGDAIQCNSNPWNNYQIEPLSAYDLSLIESLEQIQVLLRHGNRISKKSLSYFFKNAKNVNYVCNVTTTIVTEYNGTIFQPLRKVYVDNEQLKPNTNCESEQTAFETIHQMKENADILKDAYYPIINKSDINIRIYSTDYERTLSTASVLAHYLLEKDNINTDITNINILPVYVHDIKNDPFRSTRNEKCMKEKEWQEWNQRYVNDIEIQTKKLKKNFENSRFGKSIIESFKKENGIWRNGLTGYDLSRLYCNGYDIPLTPLTWNKIIDFTHIYQTTVDQSQYAKQQTICYNYYHSIPSLYIIKKNILKVLQATSNSNNNNDDVPHIVLIPSHIPVIQRILTTLDMWNNIWPENAEMVTLEIYSALNIPNKYYFRFTRLGKFLAFPDCLYDNIYNQLCDLDMLLNYEGFKYVVSMNEWQNNICPNMVNDCRCDYCDNSHSSDSHTDSSSTDKE